MTTEVEFIRRPDVLRITGLRKSTLYGLMKRASDPFPKNYPTSERGRAWIKAEVLEWCQRRRSVERTLTPIEQAVRLRQTEETDD